MNPERFSLLLDSSKSSSLILLCWDDFDGDLVAKIKEFQAKHSVTADGLCGPLTYRLVTTEREAQTELAKEQLKHFCDDDSNYIICEGQRLKIEWDNVVNIRQPNVELTAERPVDVCHNK